MIIVESKRIGTGICHLVLSKKVKNGCFLVGVEKFIYLCHILL